MKGSEKNMNREYEECCRRNHMNTETMLRIAERGSPLIKDGTLTPQIAKEIIEEEIVRQFIEDSNHVIFPDQAAEEPGAGGGRVCAEAAGVLEKEHITKRGEVMDREKIIDELVEHIESALAVDSDYVDCVRTDLLQYTVALLKEQEHRETFIVIDTKTGKEADEYNIALHEDWAKHLCYCDMDGWAIMGDGTLLLVDECGKYAYADRERFKVKWE